MPSPIRPSLPSVTPAPQSPRAVEGVRAAQRAFFDQALGKAQAPAPAPAPVRSATEAAAPIRTAPKAAPTETLDTDRLPRPGSRLDITV